MVREKKVVDYQKKKKQDKINALNDSGYIGVIIFTIILIYIIFNVFTYFTQVHIAKYEVLQGTMATNNIFTGLILRDEVIYNTEYAGSVNYYVKDYSKVGFNDFIYSVDEHGSVADKINEAKQDGITISNATAEEVVKLLDDFESSYDRTEFYHTYSLKEQINSILNEAVNLDALLKISDYADHAEQNNTFHKVRSSQDGIISYYIDGYEQVTLETFQKEMFDESTYKRTNLKAKLETSNGEAAYKLINSEAWNIILPISEELADELYQDDDFIIHIRFVKDSKEMYVNFDIMELGGSYYLVLFLKNAMVRYAADRYVDVELLLAEETGLKIPNTAITEKEFYTIPVDYFLKGDDSNAEGLLIERSDEKGNVATEFINPTIYYKTETFCYIDSEYVQSGERIVKPDSQDRYIIGHDTATLKGVYNINKGYAVFKQIEILFQNEEYSIVKTGTSYGITLYDHIALDGSKIKEDELLK